MTLQWLLSAVIAVFCTFSATLYRDSRFSEDHEVRVKRAFTAHPRFLWGTLAGFIVVAMSACALDVFSPARNPLMLYRGLLLLFGAALIAYVDYREHKIPNVLVLSLVAIRFCFLVYEFIIAYQTLSSIANSLRLTLIQPLLGALIGAGILAAAMFVSRKGVGMGDVKFFAALGLFYGSTQILQYMFYTFTASALVGIVLLVTKKARMKDSVPMAPFAMIGCMIHLYLTEGSYLL